RGEVLHRRSPLFDSDLVPYILHQLEYILDLVHNPEANEEYDKVLPQHRLIVLLKSLESLYCAHHAQNDQDDRKNGLGDIPCDLFHPLPPLPLIGWPRQTSGRLLSPSQLHRGRTLPFRCSDRRGAQPDPKRPGRLSSPPPSARRPQTASFLGTSPPSAPRSSGRTAPPASRRRRS